MCSGFAVSNTVRARKTDEEKKETPVCMNERTALLVPVHSPHHTTPQSHHSARMMGSVTSRRSLSRTHFALPSLWRTGYGRYVDK